MVKRKNSSLIPVKQMDISKITGKKKNDQKINKKTEIVCTVDS